MSVILFNMYKWSVLEKPKMKMFLYFVTYLTFSVLLVSCMTKYIIEVKLILEKKVWFRITRLFYVKIKISAGNQL